jgi:cytoskeletal protein CcmA (bactofilin family)
MFGGKKSESETLSSGKSSAGLTVNLLSSGTLFEGKIQTESDIRIDGIFKGQLSCKARLIIGPSGQFEGDCQCLNAVVEGNFQGRMKVLETLEVRENGKVRGEIQTKKLVVQSGAVFDVQCDMGNKGTAAAGTEATKDKVKNPSDSVNA